MSEDHDPLKEEDTKSDSPGPGNPLPDEGIEGDADESTTGGATEPNPKTENPD
ncbi:MAG: hypothetical protein M3296_07825 [Actinomycetota bacterium]|nr:hypothetical protein [Actinomycetota bacterium]